jgi:hypothetical protein
MDPGNQQGKASAIAAQKDFEIFVMGAYKTWSTEHLSMRRYLLFDLIMFENGNSFIKINYKQQIADIRKYLLKAFDLYLIQNLNMVLKSKLTRLRILTEICLHSTDFIQIVEKANHLTQQHRKIFKFKHDV